MGVYEQRNIAPLQWDALEQSVEGFKDNIHTGLSKTFAIFDDNLAEYFPRTFSPATIDELNTTVESLPQSQAFRALQATLQDFDTVNQREVISQKWTTHEETVNSKLDTLRRDSEQANLTTASSA